MNALTNPGCLHFPRKKKKLRGVTQELRLRAPQTAGGKTEGVLGRRTHLYTDEQTRLRPAETELEDHGRFHWSLSMNGLTLGTRYSSSSDARFPRILKL